MTSRTNRTNRTPPTAHRRNTEERIMDVLRENPGRWITSNEVSMQIKISQTREVAKRLHSLVADKSEVVMRIDQSTHKRYYCYIEGRTYRGDSV